MQALMPHEFYKILTLVVQALRAYVSFVLFYSMHVEALLNFCTVPPKMYQHDVF
jgi:hypothetical protein